MVLQLVLGNDNFQKHLASKSHQTLVHSDLWNYQLELRRYHLEVHCFHCSNIKATIISSIKVYDWLTSSEFSNLSKIKLLIPKWIFSIRSSECRVCIHCNSNPTNCSLIENVFLNELVLSGRNDESLCKSFQIVELYRSVSNHVHSFLVIIILESNTTSVKWTINKSKTNIGVFANHVEIRSGSD